MTKKLILGKNYVKYFFDKFKKKIHSKNPNAVSIDGLTYILLFVVTVTQQGVQQPTAHH